jgi:uncharacterized secreted protein with C-terminal beta-propeller domain
MPRRNRARSGLRSSRTNRQAFSVERLESRALLTATLGRGILAIRGTAAGDVIEVRHSADDAGLVEVVENGAVTFTRSLAGIRQIRIDAGGGHDEVAVSGEITVPTTINGGRGDDLLQGGGGTNRIDGGVGRDAFQSGGGRDRVTSAVRVDRLARFGTAEAFRNYLVGAARSRGGLGTMAGGVAARMNGATEALASTSMTTVTATGTAGGDAAPGYSQTNTQVAGVDEGDIIENDGRHLYILSRGELVVVDAQNSAAPTVVSRTEIEGAPVAEYLHEGRLTVLSSIWSPMVGGGAGKVMPMVMPMLAMRHAGQVQVAVYDVADPSAPRLLSSTNMDGAYVDSRMVAGRLVLVLQNDLLAGYWDGAPVIMPAVLPKGRLSVASADVSDMALTRRFRQAPVARILPTWTTTAIAVDGRATTTKPQLLSRPQDVLSPTTGNEANLTSVVFVDARAATPIVAGATSVIGGYASTLHMNAEDLYVFSPRWESLRGERTDVQRFDITGAAPRFVASGSFGGHLLNQFSADAHGELLRVAVTNTSWEPIEGDGSETVGGPNVAVFLPFRPWNMNRSNAVHVIATQGDTLAVIGSVEDIAPGESIMAARFVGDTAYMVTFEQVDPLYVLDLSTPTAPRIAGELKVPGFSRFLQPLDDGYLLGVGRDADPETGATLGLKVSLFDVRDPSAPTEVSTFLVEQPTEGWSWSDAEWDHHALGFFSELDVVALPVETGSWVVSASPDEFPTWETQAGVVVLDIDPVGGIREIGVIAHDSRLLRTARIGSTLYSVADLDLKAVDVVGLRPDRSLTDRGQTVLQEPFDWGSEVFGLLG